MYQLFYNCSSLTYVSFGNNFGSNVTNLSSLFSNCSKLNNVTFGENFGVSATEMDKCLLTVRLWLA